MTNIVFAKDVLRRCAELGVSTYCVCPGGRNAPFVELLDRATNCEVIPFFDERSAAFFALGRAQRDGRPVVVLTTSGTAVTETLSAAVEAFYSKTPLIFITADRPKKYRGTGAPQTIDQVGLYGRYVSQTLDLEVSPSVDWGAELEGSLHINVCFEEPLVDAKSEPLDLAFNEKHASFPTPVQVEPDVPSWKKKLMVLENPLVVVGSLSPEERKVIVPQLRRWKCPMYLEGTSGLREDPELSQYSVLHERLLRKDISKGLIKSVFRIGGVPTARFWRDLSQMKLPVLSLSQSAFPGGLGVEHFQCPHDLWSGMVGPAEWSWDCDELLQRHAKLEESFRELLMTFPLAEASFFAKLSGDIKLEENLYIGNSLPIRNWDLAANRINLQAVQASRGANGIDGQLATALGRSLASGQQWAVLGDLTTLYDISSLSMATYLKDQDIDFNLVVVNNGGGQIFSGLFQSSLFLNPQNVRFCDVAKGFGWEFQSMKKPQNFRKSWGGPKLIEILPDSEETRMFNESYKALCEL